MKSPHALKLSLGLFVAMFCCRAFGFFTNDLSHFTFRNWQTDNGLPHNAVTAVLQTRDGYIWFGTWQGVGRFDGVRFTKFDSPDASALNRATVRCLYETRDGVLWICTQQGVTAFQDGKFVPDPLNLNTPVRSMLESRDGSLWFATTNGLVRWRNGACTWLRKGDGLSDNNVLALCEDRTGRLWIGTVGGLTSYHEGKFGDVYNSRNGFAVNTIRTLYCDDENTLWVGTGGAGVAHLKNGELKFFTKQEGLPDLFINFIFKDSRGQLRVGTLAGVARWEDGKFVAETRNEGSAYNYCLTEDREHNLWMGTKEGLSQLLPKAFQSIGKRDGLSHDNVMSVLQDSHGTIWAGTWGGGLDGLTNGHVVVYNHPTNGLYDLVLSICESRDGSLWVGGEFDGGLFHFNDGKFTHFGPNEGLVDPVVRVIYEDSKRVLWVGTSTALYKMDGGKFERFTHADGLAGDTIRCIIEDGLGNLWIGNTEGLTRRANGRFQTFHASDGLSDNQVLSLYEDHEGTLWIGTAAGLTRVNVRAGEATPHFSRYTASDGLFNDSILEILEDDRGCLWMSSFSGVFRIRKKDFDDFDHRVVRTISCTAFGKIDGMASVQCNGVSKPAGWKAKDGRLWFTTTRGLAVVDPNAARENDSPPLVSIESVLKDKALVLGYESYSGAHHDPGNTAIIRTDPKSHIPEIIFSPGRGELELHYTALSFRAPERNRFKYRLDGFDSDWVDAGTRRTAYYNNLAPGRYEFRVVACNSDGVWNETGAVLALELQPHVWQTKWFLAAIAFFTVSGIAGSVRYFTWKRIQKRLLRLEEQHAIEKERARIARDMHDDLGARLTEISVLSEFVGAKINNAELQPHVGKISRAAREMVRNLDALVWAVNPKNDSIDQLALYIGEYVEMFLGATAIRYTLEMPEELPQRAISSEARHNLFLTIKEGLNNVVKHSAATEVLVRLEVNESALLIVIQDNGKGFSGSETRMFGNGLANMRKRIEEIAGQFNVTSKPGQGTVIRIVVCLKPQSNAAF